MSTPERRYADLGQAIKVLRERAELTQDQLADASGLHFTEISHLESGRRNPTFNTLRGVAHGLWVPRWYLFATEEGIELKRRAESANVD